METRSAARLRAEQRLNNRLPMSVGQARTIDILRVVGKIDRELSKLPEPRVAAAMTAVQLMLFTGRTIERIYSLTLAHGDPFDGQYAGREMLIRYGQGHVLSLPAGGSPTAAFPEAVSAGLADAGYNIVLELGARMARCGRQLVGALEWDRTAEPSFWRGDRKLFSSPLAELIADIDNFLRACQPLGDGDISRRLLSHNQLSTALRNGLLVAANGDAAAAHIILGNNDRAPVPSASYYLAANVGTLAEYHSKAVEALGIDRIDRRNIQHSEGQSRLWLGSRRAPSQDNIERLREKSVAILSGDRRRRGAVPDLDHLHEAVLIYTWLMWGICIGGREGMQPLLHPRQIDRESGFGIFCDKSYTPPGTAAHVVDGDHSIPAAVALTNYKTRLVWIPPHVRAQLVAYQTHLELLRVHPGLTEQNKEQLEEIIALDPTRLAFVRLTRTLDVVRLSPKSFMALLAGSAWQWHQPMNALRHYARSYFPGRVSSETIDALFGHWEVGAEPWFNGSALDPVLYRADLEHAYSELLPVADWPVLPGLKRQAGNES